MSYSVRIGTRSSKLAIVQTKLVAQLLASGRPAIASDVVHFSTQGDRNLDRPLPEIGGKGLFTAELEQALLRGKIDIAVHSLKDLPVVQSEGLTLGAIVRRADVRDCLVAKHDWTLETLPEGAVIGTSSPRRKAQAQHFRPDFEIRSIRGNVQTRIGKSLEQDFDAVILAAAGLQRLELLDTATQIIPLDIMLPAPGQGALGIQCRAGDRSILHILEAIDDLETRTTTTAERHFLQCLGGGCSAPIAAYAVQLADGSYEMSVFVALDESRMLRRRGRGQDPLRISEQLAVDVLSVAESSHDATLPTTSGAALPLHGKKIVVTRSIDQARPLADKLEAQGASVVFAPTISIVPLNDLSMLTYAISSLPDYQWLIFTSVNAVRVFMLEFNKSGSGSSVLKSVKIAAVGPATTRELSNWSLQPEFVPDSYLGSSLAEDLDIDPEDRVLLPRAENGGGDLLQILEERGAKVDDIPIYRTIPERLEDSVLEELTRGVDVLTFASGSAARSFYRTLKEQPGLAGLLDRCTVACIGPRTAEVVQKLGWHVDVVSHVHTIEGLVEGIVKYFQDTEHAQQRLD